jgi:hypothetical protein
MTNPNSPGSNPQSKPVSARVPEKIARGVVATGFMASFGPNEVVLDFLQFISRPAHLAARVVMTPVVMEQFLAVLRENLGRYTNTFGPPPVLPKHPDDRPRTAQEIYDELKVTDEQLCGVYANAVLVHHTPAEFAMDFITTFFPNAVVSARVYLSSSRMPSLVETLNNVLTQYQRQRAGQNPGGPGGPGSGPQGPESHGTAPGIPGFPTPPEK